MRFAYVLVALMFRLGLAAPAWADDLTVDSQFIDTTNQNSTLCVAFAEPLSPGLSAHYEDYVRVDHFSGLWRRFREKSLHRRQDRHQLRVS